MNTDDPLRSLRRDTITPSPEFSARVMSAVRYESAMLTPIAFPWKRALLGLIASLACFCILGYRSVANSSLTPLFFAMPRSGSVPLSTTTTALISSCGWILMAFVISGISILASNRLLREIPTASHYQT
jgi:hypothetical protein